MSAQIIHAFAEKVALVTDGANPTGRAVALQLALLGCYVIVGFSNVSEDNRNALNELQSLGTLAHAVETDVSTVEGARKLSAEVERIYGRLDLLINIVKFAPQSSFEEMTETLWTQTVSANLVSAFFVTQAAVRLMKPRPKPAIVNIVSAVDTEDAARNVAFASVQAGVVGMTKSLAIELAPKFRVNCIAVSEKKVVDNALDAELFRPKNGVDDKTVAKTAVYLLSSEAAGLTGQVFTVG